MPLSASDVLDAYRADLGNAGKQQFTDSDAAWIAFGTMLQRAVSLPKANRAEYFRTSSIAAIDQQPDSAIARALAALAEHPASPEALCAAAMVVANNAEESGAFALATAILDSGRMLVSLAEIRLQGRMLGQQARILRKIGETDLSWELFEEVADMGTTHGDRELIARAHIGKSAAARVRGNYPLVRRELLAVLELTQSVPGLEELRFQAHHGLLIASAIAKDFDSALTHGAEAIRESRSEVERLELLQNLASVCYDVGAFRSALHGYLQVLAATESLRNWIGSIGGAAVAAARLGEERIVRALADAARPLTMQVAFQNELADMTREFAEAFAYLGDAARAASYRAEALRRAQQWGYHEIIHRIESFESRAVPAAKESTRADLTPDALAVTAQLASGDSAELFAAAVSRTDHPAWNSHSGW